MKRPVIARLVLSVLLIAHLGGGSLAHAHPFGGNFAATAQGHADQCPGHHHANGLPMGGGHHPAPTGHPDCCTHSSCSGSCTGLLAFLMTPLGGARLSADRPLVIGVVAWPVTTARVFDFFRPPI